jgi:ubiquinone/menaquinone biosynthesis C-methylase UbiE
MTKEYFDQIAHKWDEIRRSLFSEAVRERAFSIAGVQKGKIAADIGAGTGFITEGLVSKDLQVIVVDQSEAMLAEMKKKFQHVNTIDYRIGEVESIPVDDESVDYVFANMLLHHVERPQIAIKEMARILKPGGILVITDLDEHNFEFLKREHHDRWMGFKREDVKRWFIETGLRDVKIESAGENCCTQSSYGDTCAISIFVASGRK